MERWWQLFKHIFASTSHLQITFTFCAIIFTFTLTLWIIASSDWSDGWGSLSLSDQQHAYIRFTLHLYSLPFDRARPHLEVPSNRATVNSNHWLHFSPTHTHTHSSEVTVLFERWCFFMLFPQGLEFAAEEAGRWAKSLFCVGSGWYEMGGLWGAEGHGG